jgi:hypothetical protein
LDRGLQRIYGGFHSRKAAFGAVNRAEDRMDVRVDQPRQDKLPLEVDHRGGGPNQRRDLCIRADGNDGVAFEGDRLLDRAGLIGRVDLSVSEDDIRLAVLSGPGVGEP